MKRKFYSTSEVARLCNVHRNTIIAAIRQGKLLAYKTPGGHARIAHNDLVKFCKDRDLPISRSVSRNDKVLVFDKAPLVAEMLKAELERHQYRVKMARDAFEAGLLAVAFLPDILLLDLEAPGTQPAVICERLRKTKVTKDVFILGMAAQPAPGVVEAAYANDLDDLIERPFEMPELIKRVTDQVGGIDAEIPIKDESHFELPSVKV